MIEENNQIKPNLEHKPKRSFNWRWVSTRLLPIFLGIIFLSAGAIAAVPSWRSAFNSFVAKFSPKAEEVTDCYAISDTVNQSELVGIASSSNESYNLESNMSSKSIRTGSSYNFRIKNNSSDTLTAKLSGAVSCSNFTDQVNTEPMLNEFTGQLYDISFPEGLLSVINRYKQLLVDNHYNSNNLDIVLAKDETLKVQFVPHIPGTCLSLTVNGEQVIRQAVTGPKYTLDSFEVTPVNDAGMTNYGEIWAKGYTKGEPSTFEGGPYNGYSGIFTPIKMKVSGFNTSPNSNINVKAEIQSNPPKDLGTPSYRHDAFLSNKEGEGTYYFSIPSLWQLGADNNYLPKYLDSGTYNLLFNAGKNQCNNPKTQAYSIGVISPQISVTVDPKNPDCDEDDENCNYTVSNQGEDKNFDSTTKYKTVDVPISVKEGSSYRAKATIKLTKDKAQTQPMSNERLRIRYGLEDWRSGNIQSKGEIEGLDANGFVTTNANGEATIYIKSYEVSEDYRIYATLFHNPKAYTQDIRISNTIELPNIFNWTDTPYKLINEPIPWNSVYWPLVDNVKFVEKEELSIEFDELCHLAPENWKDYPMYVEGNSSQNASKSKSLSEKLKDVFLALIKINSKVFSANKDVAATSGVTPNPNIPINKIKSKCNNLKNIIEGKYYSIVNPGETIDIKYNFKNDFNYDLEDYYIRFTVPKSALEYDLKNISQSQDVNVTTLDDLQLIEIYYNEKLIKGESGSQNGLFNVLRCDKKQFKTGCYNGRLNIDAIEIEVQIKPGPKTKQKYPYNKLFKKAHAEEDDWKSSEPINIKINDLTSQRNTVDPEKVPGALLVTKIIRNEKLLEFTDIYQAILLGARFSEEEEEFVSKYMYLDSNTKEWKPKVFPGDKVYFKSKYFNHSDFELKEFKIMMEIPDEAVDWTCKGEDCPDKYNYDTKNRLAVFEIDSLAPGAEADVSFFVKLKDDLPSSVKELKSWVGWGDNEINYLFEKIESKWDIWQTLKGKITGPYDKNNNQLSNSNNKPVPSILLGFIDDKNELMIGYKREGLSEEIRRKLILSDTDGNYEVDVSRNWIKDNKIIIRLSLSNKLNLLDIQNFHDSEMSKNELTKLQKYVQFYQTIFCETESGLPYQWLWIEYPIDINFKKSDSYDIEIRNEKPALNVNKNASEMEVKTAINAWSDLYYLRKILKDEKLFNTDNEKLIADPTSELEGNSSIVNIYLKTQRQGNLGSSDQEKIFINRLYFNLYPKYFPHVYLHEFAHWLQNYNLKILIEKNIEGMNVLNYPYKSDMTSNYYHELLNKNHLGYYNDTTYDSFIEAMAYNLSIYFYNDLNWYYSGKNNSWDNNLYFMPIGTPVFDTASELKPIYSTVQDKYDTEEDYITGTLLNNILTGNISKKSSFQNTTFSWLKSEETDKTQFSINLPDITTSDISKNYFNFVNSVRDNKVMNLKMLFDAYTKNNIYQDKPNEIGLNTLQQIYLLNGVFEDKGVGEDSVGKGNWIFDKNKANSIFETEPVVGTSGNYVDFKFSYGEKINFLIGQRPNRPATLINSGSFIKYNFIGDNNTKNIKITWEYPDYSNPGKKDRKYFDLPINAGDKIYNPVPRFDLTNKMYITAEGSSDYIVIKSEDYWKAMESTENYDYYMSKTFNIDGSTPPTVDEIIKIEEENEPIPTPSPTETPPAPSEAPSPTESPTPSLSPSEIPTSSITPTETPSPTMTQTELPSPSPSPTSSPIANVVDDDGNATTTTIGGSTVHIEAEGFKGASTADVYLNNKKVDTVSLVNGGEDGFGLKVDIPDNASIGANEVKIIDNQGKVASAKVNVISNKWLNKNTILILISALLLALAGYFIYRYYRPHKLTMPQ